MPWSSCSRVLEDKWRGAQLQAHRERLEAIQSASSVSAAALSAALSGATSPVRVHTKRASADGPAILAKSKSPAAKSRQRQIERDNLALINKILALDSRSRKPKAAAKPRPTSAHPARSRIAHQDALGDSLDLPAALTARDHACAPLPDAPRLAASHALYTRRSLGGLCEQHAPTLDRQAGAARKRSSAQRRILDENKKLLERILAARTTVSRAEWQRHEQEHRRLLGNISRHGLHHPAESLERERLTRSTSSALLLSGRDDIVVIGGDDVVLNADSRPSSRRRSRALLATSSSMPALPVRTEQQPSDSVVARMRRMVIEANGQ